MNKNERDQARAFAKLDYEGFRKLALRSDLSRYQRIGFPDSLRAGRESDIFQDICDKLPLFDQGEKLTVLDIGPGCSDLPRLIIEHCNAKKNRLILVDSQEMLAELSEGDGIEKIEGPFPQCSHLLQRWHDQTHVMLCYSVLHYVFAEGQIFGFFGCSAQTSTARWGYDDHRRCS